MDLAAAANAIGIPADRWKGRCHEISLALLRSPLFKEEFPLARPRVARGWAKGMSSQHSWIAMSGDCYDRGGAVLDPTLWTWREDVEGIWQGALADGIHTPHGAGHIFAWGKPCSAGGPPVQLDVGRLSVSAQVFLDMLGPLDHEGWHVLLALAPVEGWPAGNIIDCAYAHDELRVLIPIDRVGMLTNRNPEALYW